MENTENYKIELREFKLQALFVKFAHNFWVLYDDKGYIVNEIHGLATDRITQQTKAVGWPSDQLKACIYPEFKQASSIKPDNAGFSGLYRLNQNARNYLTASKEEIYTYWNKALAAANKINELNINYWATLIACTGGNK